MKKIMNEPVVPTIFAKDKKEFNSRFSILIKISKQIQIDIADGKFVKSKTVSVSAIPKLSRFSNFFEAHIMVLNPEKYIRKLILRGFRKIIFHYEAVPCNEQIFYIIDTMRRLGVLSFIALNPETPVEKIFSYLSCTDGIMLMGVHPGKENQAFIPKTLDKIKKLRKASNRIVIQIDGGVNNKTAGLMAKAGADILSTGSFVSKSDNPRSALNQLIRIFENNKSFKH